MGAVAETLFESELFGHVKGAFTDAKADKPGKFELADGGTLFLDEIGNLSYALQAKLLTALQPAASCAWEAARPSTWTCDCSAPQPQPAGDGGPGGFREDLLYRINTIQLRLPALRERPDDIVPLARMFLQRYADMYHKPSLAFSANARRRWPGCRGMATCASCNMRWRRRSS
jgi:DNA-binding NtrC family response regulator